MYVNFLCVPQAFSMAIFFLIVFSINFKFLIIPLKYQLFAKIDFEISVQRTYLKTLGTSNAAGVVGDVTENYFFVSCTTKSWE